MSTILVNKIIPMNIVEPESVYILLDISPVFGYNANGAKTDVIVGYAYLVVNSNSFCQYKVKVAQQSPLMTRESLLAMRERGERVCVEFDGLIVKVYWSASQKDYADSIKADDVHLVEEELQL